MLGACRSSIQLAAMETEDSKHIAEKELRMLETRLGELMNLCDRLKEDNRRLREQLAYLNSERSNLFDRSEQARVKVESMIGRLKNMEQGT